MSYGYHCSCLASVSLSTVFLTISWAIFGDITKIPSTEIKHAYKVNWNMDIFHQDDVCIERTTSIRYGMCIFEVLQHTRTHSHALIHWLTHKRKLFPYLYRSFLATDGIIGFVIDHNRINLNVIPLIIYENGIKIRIKCRSLGFALLLSYSLSLLVITNEYVEAIILLWSFRLNYVIQYGQQCIFIFSHRANSKKLECFRY